MALFTRFLRTLRPYRRQVLLCLLVLSGGIVAELATPRLLQTIIDQGIRRQDMPTILRLSGVMLGVTLFAVVMAVANMLLAARISQRTAADLRRDLFVHVQSFSFRNLDRLQTGGIMTRLTSDISQIAQFVMLSMRMFVRAPMMIVSSLVLLFLTDWRVASWVALVVPGLLVVFGIYARRAQPLYLRVQQRTDRVNSALQQNLAGVCVVKAFVRAGHEIRSFDVANAALAAETSSVGRMLAVLLPTVRWLINLALVAVVWFGGNQAIAGRLTAGQIIALNNYIFWFTFPLINLAMSAGFIASAGASMRRIFDVLDTPPAVADPPQPVVPAEARGRVAFEGVTFYYNGEDDHEEDAVLQGVDLVVEPGQRVAIVGATGSGKSTLLNLIPRFYDVSGGRVTFDGIDVRDLSLDWLRAQIGVVLQDTVLFSGTIRDNICYGRPEASEEEVIAAAQAAQAHEFITGLAQGYDTPVGQRGATLSGGQRQRIGIARALLLQPPVLLMDDATSAIDVQTEARLLAALRERMRGRTQIVVAQRISTVLHADKIVVLDRGRISDSGTHAELVERSPIYREIVQSQLGVLLDGDGAIATGEE